MSVHLSDEPESQYLFKVLVVGDGSVGKSNILLRYTRGEFRESSKTTIGVELCSKSVEVEPGVVTNMQLWDTAGQERYQAVTKAYYRHATGCIFVYDVTNRKSFARVKFWMDEVANYIESPNAVYILVGNKSDLAHARAISLEEAAHFARLHNFTYLCVF
eukprot:EC714131.1.p1 GENE.EC714131.1~~EC714131.1.p1  ORF type:complete len:160 (+),score=1.58 EC714131.1:27-506(+)